jgi:hypothetical protein
VSPRDSGWRRDAVSEVMDIERPLKESERG